MFQFKQFTVNDARSAMKIGTDGILLGCWATVSSAHQIIDIGTGCGVIALQCAQKNKSAHITGLEIDTNAFTDAVANFQQSAWKERLTCINQSLQFFSATNNTCFDTIISNPPFFEKSQKATEMGRLHARHTDVLHYTDIFEFSYEHLANIGSVQLILPAENAEKCIEIAKEYGLYATRICKVRPIPQKAFHRWLLHLVKTNEDIPCDISELTIETGVKRHEYTDAYTMLCKDFYLHF
jgi:tRNA1Val (adenine37-N6)-methyltransferase